MPRSEDDWSDSDEEDLSQVETSVLLGVPDGNVENDADKVDAAVSRIGGLPALLPSREPPISSSHCKSCSHPMELLVQMWCPFENSPMDRALYIWGCARTGCQGKNGSVRAWRGIRVNEKYAEKLARKRQRQLELARDQQRAAEEQARLAAQRKNFVGGNPFAMGGKAATNAPIFGLGAQIFGAPPAEGTQDHPAEGEQLKGESAEEGPGSEASDDDSDTEEELLTALAATLISESAWKSAPSYSPLYLSTTSEYIPPPQKPKLPKGVQVEDLDGDDKKDTDMTWAKETYEDSLEVDHVFERFMNRVKHEGEQCVRYELNGTPLPFAHDATFDLLWPAPVREPLPVTKPDFKVVWQQKREYTASAVPRCPVCNSVRVFECQLMPNLINVLRPVEEGGKGKKLTDEERRTELEKALKGDDEEAKRGMEWGTCLVFSCEKDCCLEEGKEGKEAWREEEVYIQWDV